MKNRFGFVSNSSSSSYIVINKEGSIEKIPDEAFNEEGELMLPSEQGSYCFGCCEEWYGYVLDRINFAFCQVMYLCEEIFPPKEGTDGYEYYDMFVKALEREGIKPKFILTAREAKAAGQSVFALSIDFYIDHKSSAIEGQNMEIFYSIDDLHDFLFNFGSGINMEYL